MAQYIDKSALVAEIERRIENNTEWKDACKTLAVIAANQAIEEDKKILSIIDTIELKEMDLEKVFNDEYSKFSNDTDAMDYAFPIDLADYKDFAKHFFELGLNTSNPLTWEDMRELYIIFADVDVGIELCKTDIQAETIGYYQEVLKRFKAQKGEEV